MGESYNTTIVNVYIHSRDHATVENLLANMNKHNNS